VGIHKSLAQFFLTGFKQLKTSISIFMRYSMPLQFKWDLAFKVKLCNVFAHLVQNGQKNYQFWFFSPKQM